MSAAEGAIHTPPAEHGDYASSGEPGRPAAGLPHSERAGHPRRPGGWSARITRRHLVVTLGLIWLLDGLLQLQPYMYTPTFAGDTMQYMTMGRPNLVTDLIAVATRLTYSTLDRQAAYNTLAAVLQIAIGIGLIWYRTERPALIGSALWGLGPWIVGEGLGGMIFPQASMAIGGAPGAAVIYSLLSIVLWPRRPIDTAAEWSAADSGLLGRRGALVMWAVIWFGTALLELEHSNWAPGSVAAQLRTQAEGQVAWIAALEHAAAHLTAGHGTEVALAMLVVQSWVGVAVLRRATRKAALVVGIVVSLVYWVLGQVFGGIPAGTGTDPNLGPLMVLYAGVLWPRPADLALAGVATDTEHASLDTTATSWGARIRAGAERARGALVTMTAVVVVVGVAVAATRGIVLARTSSAATTAAAVRPLSVGSPAPNGAFFPIDAADTDVGQVLRPSDASLLSRVDRPTLVYFIATWCSSCEAGTQVLVHQREALAHVHVHVVLLDLAGDLSNLSPLAAAHRLARFAQAFGGPARRDPQWTWGVSSSTLTKTYDPKGLLDVYYLIGRSGRIDYRGSNLASNAPALLAHL